MKKIVGHLMLLVLTGCAVGPDYKKPDAPAAAKFRQAVPDENLNRVWKPVNELRQVRDPRPWWEQWWGLPAEDELARWLAEVERANPSVNLLAAQYRQAEAVLTAARASWWPSLSTTVSSSRGQGSVASSGSVSAGGDARITDKVGMTAAWEVDLWGRISRGVESGEASLSASAADLKAGVLSAQATFAQTYLQWQVNHLQQTLLEQSMAANQRIVELTRVRHQAGMVARSDVLQAESQLNAVKAQRLDLGIQQAQLEHAMAVLVGKAPVVFVPPGPRALPALPALPALLPAQVLLNRWDITAAERRVAAANAQVGVAQAAFFPTLSLGGSLSYQDSTFQDIISAPNRVWSFGPSLALTLFDGGARSSARRQAEAVLEQRTVNYRQTVLTAFQEVEDQLAILRVLGEEEGVQRQSTAAAREALQLSEHQYAAGTVAYLSVATAQASALAAEKSLLDIRLRRMLAGITLIKAVGGQIL